MELGGVHEEVDELCWRQAGEIGSFLFVFTPKSQATIHTAERTWSVVTCLSGSFVWPGA